MSTLLITSTCVVLVVLVCQDRHDMDINIFMSLTLACWVCKST